MCIRHHLCLLIFLVTSLPVAAASPEQDYIAARDAAIAKLEKSAASSPDAVTRLHKAIAKDLTSRLERVVSPISVKGFSRTGSYNTGSVLNGDLPNATLDGMIYETADQKGTLLVTTEPLYKLWIRQNTTQWAQSVPAASAQSIERLLHVPDFYATALTSDAALYDFGELPISTPPKTTAAAALLISRSQDETPLAPYRVIAGLVICKLLLIAEVPLKTPLSEVAVCNASRKTADTKLDAATEKTDAQRAEITKAFIACFAEKAKAQKTYPAVLAQAQALLLSMAGR